jgi:hypothetical protein
LALGRGEDGDLIVHGEIGKFRPCRNWDSGWLQFGHCRPKSRLIGRMAGKNAREIAPKGLKLA